MVNWGWFVPFSCIPTSSSSVSSSSTLPACLCRILGRQHFFWGWRKSWKPRSWRRMISHKLQFSILMVELNIWWFSLFYACMSCCSPLHMYFIECTYFGFKLNRSDWIQGVSFNEVAWVWMKLLWFLVYSGYGNPVVVWYTLFFLL